MTSVASVPSHFSGSVNPLGAKQRQGPCKLECNMSTSISIWPGVKNVIVLMISCLEATTITIQIFIVVLAAAYERFSNIRFRSCKINRLTSMNVCQVVDKFILLSSRLE